MVKQFCDVCGLEIDDGNNFDNLSVTIVGGATLYARLDVREAVKPSSFRLCKYCAIEAFLGFDDRKD